MFEVGFQELVLIALLALIVLGPEKLPKLAAQLGRWTGRARSMARNLRQQLEQEVSYDDLLKQKQAAEDALRRANAAPMDFHNDIAASINPEPPADSPAPQPTIPKVEPTPPVAMSTTGVQDTAVAATDPVK
jgi:sec-independent protein translocase protein TatB